MGNEVAPEFMFEQGIYYPPADYYGYYRTANELPGEWDDHHSFFGSDGQDVHYSVLQTENLPYVYYTPSYGYAESSYNPYNPYIPGAVVDFGTQQYVTSPYQQTSSSPAYVPVVVQSSSDINPYNIPDPSDPSYFSTVAPVSVNPDYVGPTFTPSLASAVRVPTPLKIASRIPASELSKSSSKQIKNLPKDSEETVVTAQSRKLSSLNGVVVPEFLPHATQSRNSSLQSGTEFSFARVPPFHNSSKVKFSPKNDFTNYLSSFPRSSNEDKLDTKFQPRWFSNSGTRRSYLPSEENRGPRASRGRSQWTSITVKAYTKKLGACDSHDNIIIVADQYNRDDFSLEYPNAKFYVIKSYNEDDVHKSIKYNVWSSTCNGNKKLNAAYEDAQRISGGRPGQCPVFLFFSVNSSGHFCGVAEMVGHVDFHKDMDFWQQDKWTGSFPVRWHIIKDVPNSSFRHIILENNENRPVTHSRDTQELNFVPGLNMLEVFKIAPLKESILDDFMYYEEREKVMYQEKVRILKRHSDAPIFIPANVHSKNLNATFVQTVSSNGQQSSAIQKQSSEADILKQAGNEILETDKKQSKGLDHLPKVIGQESDRTAAQTPEAYKKHPADVFKQHREADANGINNADYQPLSEKGNTLIDQPKDLEEKLLNGAVTTSHRKQLETIVDQPSEVEGQLSEKTTQEIQANNVLHSSKIEERQLGGVVVQPQVQANANVDSALKFEAANPLDNKKDPELGPLAATDVVTIGSLQIKVNNTQKSPAIFSVGCISVDSRKKI